MKAPLSPEEAPVFLLTAKSKFFKLGPITVLRPALGAASDDPSRLKLGQLGGLETRR
jgi:hypothetical protein